MDVSSPVEVDLCRHMGLWVATTLCLRLQPPVIHMPVLEANRASCLAAISSYVYDYGLIRIRVVTVSMHDCACGYTCLHVDAVVQFLINI